MADPAEQLLELARAKFPDLTAPEERLVHKAASGGVADFTGEDEKPTIRAEVLAWLAADPAATEHVHHKGLQLRSAKIEGGLDLQFANIPYPLRLIKCVVEQEIILRHARVPALYLNGTRTGPIGADGLRVEGDLFLRNGFHANGEVRLLGAEIGGNLECDGGRLENPTGVALNADGIHVRGSVFLRNEFVAKGEVRLLGVEVGGDLDCESGSFKNPGGGALMSQGIHVQRNVVLSNGFAADGAVGFLGAKIGGTLWCEGGTFNNPEKTALDLEGAQITGSLHLRALSQKPDGRVDLRSARVGELADDSESWPNAGELVLDGFTYDHLARAAPHSAEERLKWIGLQPPDAFSIQPYEQLAKVLRSMGLEQEARRVAIAKQRALRARLPWWRKPWSAFLDISIGYGYRPWQAVLWLFYLWVIGVTYLHGVEITAAMCATKASAYGGQACVAPSGYPQLAPAVYLIDTLLPFIDLHQEVYWEPDANKPLGATLRASQWVYIGLGWLFSILAAVGFSGILRKD